MPWVCDIYEDRPELCKKYPEAGSLMMKSCGFFFPGDGTRRGRCVKECEAACCRMPRIDGEPTNPGLPEAVGGLPCKHLVWTEEDIPFEGEKVEPTEGEMLDQPDDPSLDA